MDDGPQIDSRSLKWFTDGSKTDHGVGCGVFGPNTELFVAMGKWPTVFQAEVHAITLCARVNLEKGLAGAHIAIFSDSQAALKALQSWTFKSRQVLECYETLQKLSTRNKVTLYWVPGHKGIEGNEKADELARKGSSTTMVGPEPFCGIGWSTVKSLIKDKEIRRRNVYWNCSDGLKQSKLLINPFSYKEALSYSRYELRVLTGFLTGHFGLNYHLRKLALSNTTICRLCLEDDETTLHVLCDCPALISTLIKIFVVNYTITRR